MILDSTRRNIGLLSVCQALLFTNNSTTIAINVLAGLALAPVPEMASVPPAAWLVGTALATVPASLLMKRLGRRAGFMIGTAVGMVGAAVAAYGLVIHAFWLLSLGTLILGAYNAVGQFYRFAAADLAEPAFKSKAIGYVLAGGLVGGILGPALSRSTVDLLPARYAGAYLSLIGFMVIALAVMSRLRIPAPGAAETRGVQRPLVRIMAQPVFIVAAASAAISYGIMNLLMLSTPLEMTAVCGYPYDSAASVISAHVVAMFAPSFFTGALIKRFGILRIMTAGAAVLLTCALIAFWGVSIAHFFWAMSLLGLGWNFVFIGATTLLTEAYRPAERAKTQGINDLLVFGTTMTSALSAGTLLQAGGWRAITLMVAGFAIFCGLILLLFSAWRRAHLPPGLSLP